MHRHCIKNLNLNLNLNLNRSPQAYIYIQTRREWFVHLDKYRYFSNFEGFPFDVFIVVVRYRSRLSIVFMVTSLTLCTLQWRHNGRDGVSNHQLQDCLLNPLFRRRSKKAPKCRVTGLCEGNSPVTGEFPAQRASNAENVSIWWRHHDQRLSARLQWPRFNALELSQSCSKPSVWSSLFQRGNHEENLALRWRHNDHDGGSNHQPHGCLLNRLFRRKSRKTSKLRVTGLCVGNSPGPVNSPHKGPVTRKMFPFDDVIMGRMKFGLRRIVACVIATGLVSEVYKRCGAFGASYANTRLGHA